MMGFQKRIFTLFMLAVLVFSFTACSKSDAKILKPYGGEERSESLTSIVRYDRAAGFARNLATAAVSATTGEGSKVSGVEATEILLVDRTHAKMLKASNIYKTMPPASLTKILTALVALRSNMDLDALYTLGNDIYVDVPDAQVCGFKAGDRISLRTLLYCMLVYSGNDSANAVASIVGGGDISSFCDQMNKVAGELGAIHTNFVTPHGLDDPKHYSTAYDLYLIFNECLNYELFVDAISKAGYTASFIRDGEEKSQYYETTNYFLSGVKQYPDGVVMVGGKTGTTDKAGTCLMLYVKDSEDNGYISILLGSPDKDSLYMSMANLLAHILK